MYSSEQRINGTSLLGSSCEKVIVPPVQDRTRQDGGLGGKFSEGQLLTDIDEKMMTRGKSINSTQRADSLTDKNI